MPETLPSTLAGWLARCEHGHPKAIDMTLDRVRAVKERLGLRFDAPVIVVGGTNGKGSTCAMLEAIALAAGWRVGVYSKPHLVHFEERCRLGGVPVAGDALAPHFAAVEAARGTTTLTYFEHTTLALMHHLAAQPLDLVVLEVGLGGRCDAVNVVDADCSVITTIDLDHTEYLGPTREAIAREKAGIWRTGRPAVLGDPSPPPSLIALALDQRVDLRAVGQAFWTERATDGTWSFCTPAQRWSGLPRPALPGGHQLGNAAAALAALTAVSRLPAVPTDALQRALETVWLAGRFQVWSHQPNVVLDVAHNRQAVQALADTLSERVAGRRVVAVFGCMQDKDFSALGALMPLVKAWHFTSLPTPRAASARQLREALSLLDADAGLTASTWPDVKTALDAARSSAEADDWIVVFGSFWTVGGVMAASQERGPF
jgi:dihydrofolate synthase/folylpolyglutamate synthase